MPETTLRDTQRIYAYLLTNGMPTNDGTPLRKRIGQATGIGERRVSMALKELAEQGLLKRKLQFVDGYPRWQHTVIQGQPISHTQMAIPGTSQAEQDADALHRHLLANGFPAVTDGTPLRTRLSRATGISQHRTVAALQRLTKQGLIHRHCYYANGKRLWRHVISSTATPTSQPAPIDPVQLYKSLLTAGAITPGFTLNQFIAFYPTARFSRGEETSAAQPAAQPATVQSAPPTARFSRGEETSAARPTGKNRAIDHVLVLNLSINNKDQDLTTTQSTVIIGSSTAKNDDSRLGSSLPKGQEQKMPNGKGKNTQPPPVKESVSQTANRSLCEGSRAPSRAKLLEALTNEGKWHYDPSFLYRAGLSVEDASDLLRSRVALAIESLEAIGNEDFKDWDNRDAFIATLDFKQLQALLAWLNVFRLGLRQARNPIGVIYHNLSEGGCSIPAMREYVNARFAHWLFCLLANEYRQFAGYYPTIDTRRNVRCMTYRDAFTLPIAASTNELSVEF